MQAKVIFTSTGVESCRAFPAQLSLNLLPLPCTMAQAVSAPHSIELCSRLASAQKYGELCDLVLMCNGQTIPVHKAIVCLQSPVIKAACTGQFMEASGVYEFKDTSFETVQRMVDYLYTGDYQNKAPDPGPSAEVHEMVVHVTMFSLADVYLIDGLLTLAETKFRAAVKGESTTTMVLKHVIEVYSLQCDSSKVLREIVVENLRERVAYSIPVADQQVLESLLHELPDFARDVAKSYVLGPAKAPSSGRCANCPCKFCRRSSLIRKRNEISGMGYDEERLAARARLEAASR
ncbi:hypothetical protein V8C44DRAFT_335854 [Trichoderma aethiopicum]